MSELVLLLELFIRAQLLHYKIAQNNVKIYLIHIFNTLKNSILI